MADMAGSALSGAATGATIGSVIPGVGTAVGALVGAGTSIISGLLNNSAQDAADEKNRALFEEQRGDQLKQQDFSNNFALAGAATSKLENQQVMDFNTKKEAYTEKTEAENTDYTKKQNQIKGGLDLLNQPLAMNAASAAPFMKGR